MRERQVRCRLSNEQLVSVILPVHNQANHLENVIVDYRAALERFSIPHEFVLVANGCRDETVKICRDLSNADPRVRVCELEAGGWGLAVKTGIQASRGEIICFTNSARTSSNDLALLLNYARVNKDTVIKANRKIRESFKRRLGSLLYNLECRALFDLPTWDINGTPKVFPRRYAPLLDLQSSDDLIDLEFNVLCRNLKYPILEIPIISTRRHSGRSTTNYSSAFKMYFGAIKLWWKRKHRA